MRRTGLFGISKEDLLEWIRNSNYCDNGKLAEAIGSDNINKEKDAKYNLIDIINGSPIGNVTDGAVTDTNKVYKTFEELPKDIILDVNAGSKNGVEWLIGKYKRYYSKKRKQSLFDLDLKKEGEVKKLIESIRRFCRQFNGNDDVKNFIEGVKDENEKRSTSRIAVRWGVTIALLVIGFTALFSNFFVPIEIIIDNVTIQIGELLATLCGILDFMLGIIFAWREYKEDESERLILNKVENALTEFKEVVPKVVDDVKGAASDVKIATANAKIISDDYGKKIKEVEKVRESLKICKQCHVPLENDCNVCGHKNDPEMMRSIDTTDYISRGKKSKKIEKDPNPGNWTIKSCNWTIKECGEGCYTVIFNNKNIVLKTEQVKMCTDQDGLTDEKYVKKIVFNEYVKTVRLKDDDDTTDYQNIRGIFSKVEIVAFAQPTPNKETGQIIRQYKLGKDIFKELEGKVNVKGLEYIAKAEEGCFAGWDEEYCRLAGLNVGQKCFKKN